MNTLLSRRDRIYALAVLLLTATALFLYGQIPYANDRYATTDLYHYRQMAEAAPALAEAVQQPYAFRILGPYLAGLLPLPDVQAFYVLTVLAALTLGQLLYHFLRSTGIAPPAALLATTFFLLNKHLFGVHVWGFFQLADLFSFIFLILLLWAMRRGRWTMFGLGLLLGAMSKETALLAVPVAAVYLWEKGRLRAEGGRFLLAVLPGLALFLALRWLIEPAGGLGLFEALARHTPKLARPETWFRLWINPFIPFALLPLVFYRTTLAFFRARLHLLALLALVFLSALFGSNNERLMAPAFVVFYPLIAVILQAHFRGERLLLVLMTLAAVAAALHHEIARFPLPDRSLVLILSLSALAVVTLVGLWRAVIRPQAPARTNFEV